MDALKQNKEVSQSSVRPSSGGLRNIFRDLPSVSSHELTYYRDGIKWSFDGGQLLVDDLNVNRLINDNPDNVNFFMGIAEGLADYRKRVVAEARDSDQFAKFDAVMEALLGKILGKLKKFYDQKMSGVSWTLSDGQLVLNGINIRSFLALYRLRKTDKARKFLSGLRGRLADLLENRRESPDYERIRDFVTDLYQEVDRELGPEMSARPYGRLLPAASCAY
jgi:hypothetical protein